MRSYTIRTRQTNPSGQGGAINWGNPLTANLIGCWDFRGGFAGSARDLTGRYGDGVVGSSGGDPVITGQGMYFDWSRGGYVEIPTSSRYSLASAVFSIEVRFIIETSRNWNGLVSKCDPTNQRPFDSYVSAAELVSVGMGDTFQTNLGGSGLDAFPAGRLMELSWGCAPPAGDVRMDGLNIFTTAGGIGSIVDSGTFRIGNRADNATPMGGWIQFVRLWNRKLSNNEMIQLYLDPDQIMNRRPFVFGGVGGGFHNSGLRMLGMGG